MTLHTKVSYAKSVLRIIGYVLLMLNHIVAGAAVLLGAELLGIAEELPGAYKGTLIDAEIDVSNERK